MEYKLIRSKRKSISIEIKSHGEVIVRVPMRISQTAINNFLNEKAEWIDAHVNKAIEQSERAALIKPISPSHLKRLTDQARIVFTEKAEYYAKLMNVTYGKITIRHQTSRWGSCSSKGNLNFNCLLMLAPEEIQDYVVVHELAHRREMNHSAKFWAIVESVLPDYKDRRNWLSVNGRDIMARLENSTVRDSIFYTYILRCADGSLYTGYTTNLEARIRAHNSGKGAKYTRSRRPVTLAYYETFQTKQDAQSREAIIKQLSKAQKEQLILKNTLIKNSSGPF